MCSFLIQYLQLPGLGSIVYPFSYGLDVSFSHHWSNVLEASLAFAATLPPHRNLSLKYALHTRKLL